MVAHTQTQELNPTRCIHTNEDAVSRSASTDLKSGCHWGGNPTLPSFFCLGRWVGGWAWVTSVCWLGWICTWFLCLTMLLHLWFVCLFLFFVFVFFNEKMLSSIDFFMNRLCKNSAWFCVLWVRTWEIAASNAWTFDWNPGVLPCYAASFGKHLPLVNALGLRPLLLNCWVRAVSFDFVLRTISTTRNNSCSTR